MVRALWTAASGMIAQQTNVDNIANNLANVNTTGYKTSTAEFKSLLYQTIQTKTTSANGDNKPIGAQVGLGTRTSSITTQFTLWQIDMSVARRLKQSVHDAALDSEIRISFYACFSCNLIGDSESHSRNVIREAVWILLHNSID